MTNTIKNLIAKRDAGDTTVQTEIDRLVAVLENSPVVIKKAAEIRRILSDANANALSMQG